MIPPAHILAEVAACPLATEEAFDLALPSLNPALDRDTARLWRSLEKDRAGRDDGRSLDLLVAARDAVWFGRPPPADTDEPRAQVSEVLGAPVRLEGMLCRLVHRILDVRGPDAAVRPCTDGARDLAQDPAASWRWLTLALPEDLLLVCASGGQPIAQVRLASPALRRCIEDRGLAELHLHVGASASFRHLWASALRALGQISIQQGGIRQGALASPGAVFRDGQDFAGWLVAGAIARQALGTYAALPRGARAGIWAHAARYPGLGAADRQSLTATLLDLLAPGATPALPFATLQALYRAMWPLGAPRAFPGAIDQIQDLCDPLAHAFPPLGDITPEMRSLHALLRLPLSQDELRLLWQVQRLRCLYYRHVTQQPMVAGLQWFVRWYARIGPLRGPIQSVLVECAAETDTGGEYSGLRSLEVRTTPECDVTTTRATLRALLCSWWRAREALCDRRPPWRPEFGVVLHFAKNRDGTGKTWRRGTPAAAWADTAANPAAPQFLRYRGYFVERTVECFGLRDLLQHEPRWLWYFRGIDVCTDELGVPTWVIAPLFRFVREAADDALAQLVRESPRPKPLRATAHAGEDFVHLLGGLRRVHEAVTYLTNKPGDRLGHAVALGTDPRAWAEKHRAVQQSVEERLFDLVFEHSVWTGRGRGRAPAGRQGWLERQISVLAGRMFWRGLGLDTLVEALHRLHTELVTRALGPWPWYGYPWGTNARARRDDPDDVLLAYLSDPGVFADGQDLITVPLDDAEIAALDALVGFLRAEVASRELLVEVNPSSNLLIGDLRALADHPILRLDPPEDDGPGPRVRVGIGSDDPITFCSSLPQEYDLLRSVAEARTSARQAERWIEHIRERSLDARFTLDPPDGVLEALLEPGA